jgi:hypothetical protein
MARFTANLLRKVIVIQARPLDERCYIDYCKPSDHNLRYLHPLGTGTSMLAHHGILLLDARPEFRHHVLEVLRQPPEKSLI